MPDFLYGTAVGRLILKILTRPFISKAAGFFMNSRLSALYIPRFIKKNNINTLDFEERRFKSFNDFFTRRLKSGKREFLSEPSALISPCDGLLTVYDIDSALRFKVKNSIYGIESLLNNASLASEFSGGQCLVFRLTPSHYHRFHYFDNGETKDTAAIKGVLHTVRPVAVESVPVYTRNSREIAVLQTENFGNAVMVEVGAMMVGKIINRHQKLFCRGDEKGFFEFGGSTIILLLKKNAAKILPEISIASRAGEEFPVLAGQKIGSKI